MRLWAGLLLLVLVAAGIAIVARSSRTPVLVEQNNSRARTAPPPRVEPLVLLEVPPEKARAINASVPFVAGPFPALGRFVHPGPAADRDQARTCLARAAWYEAGDDRLGQQAVAQVVLNRLRHPAFPKTVCAVIYQGAERASGCQFSFTCDGSLRSRVPPAEAWQRALQVAEAALSGFVLRQVGTATHYHTDWVVPHWSASLDKITEVHTHLFFRWRGWWGQVAAFAGRYHGPEVPSGLAVPGAKTSAELPKIELSSADVSALLADNPGAGYQAPEARSARGTAPKPVRGNIVRLRDDKAGQYALALASTDNPDEYAVAALALCGKAPVCTVAGWLDPTEVPARLPISAAVPDTTSFIYRRGGDAGGKDALWNCRQIPRSDRSKCMRFD